METPSSPAETSRACCCSGSSATRLSSGGTMTVSSRTKFDCPSPFSTPMCASRSRSHYQLPSRLAPVHAVPRSILVAQLPRLLAHRPACFDPVTGLHQHGSFPQKAGDNLTVRNYRKKMSPGAEENQARLARAELFHRAGGSVFIPRRRRSRTSVTRTPAPEHCVSCPPCPAFLKVTAGPPAFPNRFTAPSFTRAFGCLQLLAWRLGCWAGASQPPERLRSPFGLSVNVSCPCRPGAATHLASLRPPAIGFGRCRQSRVSGKRSQTLNA